MGNMFIKIKNQNSKPNSLSRSLLSTNLEEKINYLNDKLDMLDDKIWSIESNTQTNFKLISNDLHVLNKKINEIKN